MQRLGRFSRAAFSCSQAAGYVCPLTGQVLPCPGCCLLNNGE